MISSVIVFRLMEPTQGEVLLCFKGVEGIVQKHQHIKMKGVEQGRNRCEKMTAQTCVPVVPNTSGFASQITIPNDLISAVLYLQISTNLASLILEDGLKILFRNVPKSFPD